MRSDKPLAQRRFYPIAVWLLLLGIVFSAEYAVMLLLPWLVPKGAAPIIHSAVDAIVLTVVLAPVLWWVLVRPLMETNRLRTQFLADLFAQIESDRRRTAHELHDGVGQSLTVLISGLRSARSCRAVDECANRVNSFQRLAEAALMEVRRLSLGLRPSLLDDFGLAAALERLVEDVCAHHSVKMSLDLSGITGHELPEQIATCAFRIVQEAVTNIMKHSEAAQAAITLRETDGNLFVEVSDEGRGIEPAQLRSLPNGHLGLRGMRERAAMLGGVFSLDSTPGRGTRIRVTIPIKGAQGG